MEYAQAVRQNWVAAILIVVGLVLATTTYSFLQPREYTATNRQYLGIRGGATVNDLAQKVDVTSDLMTSYAELATSPLVLDKVVVQLSLDSDSAELAEQVTVTVPIDTLVLEISATDQDPVRAAEISNAVARQFENVVQKLPQVRAGKSDVALATVIQVAEPPLRPSSPDIARNISISFALGVVLAVIVSLLLARYRPVRRDGTTQPVNPDWNWT